MFFYLGIGAPTVLAGSSRCGSAASSRRTLIEALRPYLPRPVDLQRKSCKEKFLGTFRCQTYWLLATRAAWRVLWSIWRTGALRGGEDRSRDLASG